MIARTEEQLNALRAGGKILGGILRDLAARAMAGTTARELDAFAEKEIRAHGAVPVFLNYETDGAPYPYPATLCVSINNEVVHGIPAKEKIIKEGDVVSLDCGLLYHGLIVDAAVTVIVGEGTEDTKRLVRGASEALDAGIAAAKAGGHVGDIGAAVSDVAQKYGLGVVRDLGGHGTGKKLHEDPYIANFGTPGEGEKITAGMVLALEPIFTLGRGGIKMSGDGWTYKTTDSSLSSHFEHTIVVGENGAEVVTRA